MRQKKAQLKKNAPAMKNRLQDKSKKRKLRK